MSDAKVKAINDIVVAYVAQRGDKINAHDVVALTKNLAAAFSMVGGPLPSAEPDPDDIPTPIAVQDTVQRDFIVCLEDGKQLKMLKRHLMSKYGMTPAQYRAKWGLPKDYPMVAPGYSLQRRIAATAQFKQR